MDEVNNGLNQKPIPQTTAAQQGMSDDSKTLITILLLFFFYPVGLLLAWVWTKWKLWIKFLVTLPVFFIFLVLPLVFVVLIAINPAEQIAKANNQRRLSDLQNLMNAFNQYKAANFKYPVSLKNKPIEISSVGLDICEVLVPQYLSGVPLDPSVNTDESIADCSKQYDSNYTVTLNEDDTLTLSATNAELDEVIEVTR